MLIGAQVRRAQAPKWPDHGVPVEHAIHICTVTMVDEYDIVIDVSDLALGD